MFQFETASMRVPDNVTEEEEEDDSQRRTLCWSFTEHVPRLEWTKQIDEPPKKGEKTFSVKITKAVTKTNRIQRENK